MDTRAFDLPAARAYSYGLGTLVVRCDGRIFISGLNTEDHCEVPDPPLGRRFVDAKAGIGLLDDGTLVQWGNPIFATAPQPPANTRYVRMSTSGSMLLRSDGALVVWGPNQYGQAALPPIPPGSTIVDFESNGQTSGIRLSTGNWLLFGRNHTGQTNMPPLPPGTTYTKMSFGFYHTVALRSDGVIVPFGGVGYPSLLAVPPLPPGTTYVDCAAGSWHSLALRSDGLIVGWGSNYYGQCDAPLAPPGTTFTQFSCGLQHSSALLSDGRVVTWGAETYWGSGIPARPVAGTPFALRHADAAINASDGVIVYSDGRVVGWGAGLGNSIPQFPPGVRIRSVGANGHMLGLGSDGRLYGWGSNQYGQLNVPAPPPGTTYVDFALGHRHSVAVRSDGQAVAVGSNAANQCSLPALPPGVRYVKAAADFYKTALLRSDGQIAIAGSGFTLPGLQIPPLPPGLAYVDVAVGDYPFAAIRSDGTGIEWGFGPGGSAMVLPVPALPYGVSYVEVVCGDVHCAWRRSDGQVVASGYGTGGYAQLLAVRPLEPGTSYLGVAARYGSTIARVGPTTTYVTYASGCAGSRPSTRLIPRDTPRVGRELEIRLFDLPQHVAILAMGLQAAPAQDLSILGMPGCLWRTSLDATAALVGAGNQAVHRLPIPDQPSLVGLQFFHQAIVLDPAAANAMGWVVSDAARGVIGYP